MTTTVRASQIGSLVVHTQTQKIVDSVSQEKPLIFSGFQHTGEIHQNLRGKDGLGKRVAHVVL